ncbi:MAG: hypothetical protein ACLT9P_00785 [Evtepia gabavorous]
MELPEEVLIYVAENITSNVRQIEGTVKKILAFRDLLGSNVDASSVTRAVRDMFKENSDILPTRGGHHRRGGQVLRHRRQRHPGPGPDQGHQLGPAHRHRTSPAA